MYKRKATGWLKHVDFMLWDMLSLHIAFFLAYIIRHGFGNMYKNQLYANMAMSLTLMEIVGIIAFGTLHNVLKRGYWVEAVATFKQVALVVVMASLYLFTVQAAEDFSRMVLYVTALLYGLLGYSTRTVWKIFLRKHMKNGGKHSLLIITSSDMLERIQYNLENHNYEMFQVIGIVVSDQNMQGKYVGQYPVVANLSNVIEYAQERWVDEVFINLLSNADYPEQIASQFLEMGVVVHTRVSEHLDVPGQKSFVEKLGKYTVITTTINYASPRQLFMKRCLDIVGGLVGSAVALILCVIIGPFIYIQSPGPIFFKQE